MSTQQTLIQLTVDQQNQINNVRAVVKRQLRPTSTVDPELVADLILRYAPLMRQAALGLELLEYLEYSQYRFPEGSLYHTHLMLETAVTLDDTDSLQEAHPLYRTVLDRYSKLPIGDVRVDYANAHLSYGRHLLNLSQLEDALSHFHQALNLLAEGNEAGVAIVRYELGCTLLQQGKLEKAVSHFQHALSIYKQPEDLVRIQTKLASTLIQLGQLEQAESLIEQALETCDADNLWYLRGSVYSTAAYVAQAQADIAQNKNARLSHLERTKILFIQAIEDLLPLKKTYNLAVAYHDLGRLQAQLHEFAEAETHVRMSSEMFSRIGSRRNFAVAQITLGQILLLKNGNITAATERIRQALNIAGDLGDSFTLEQAAESLVRIHKIQAKNVQDDNKQSVVDEIGYTLSRFEHFHLNEYASKLLAIVDESGIQG